MQQAKFNPRFQGVVKTTTEAPKLGPEETIVTFTPMQAYFVEYYDKAGRLHRSCFYQLGGDPEKPESGALWEHPGSEQWVKDNFPIQSWFLKKLEIFMNKLRGNKQAAVPKVDSVDVMGSR